MVGLAVLLLIVGSLAAKAQDLKVGVGGAWASSTEDDMMVLITHPDSGITSVNDLKGTKIGATFGSASDAYRQELLKADDIAFTDIEHVNVSPPSMTSVLETGGVDTVVAWEPCATRTLDKMPNARLIQRGGNLICFCGLLHGSPAAIYRDEALTQRFVDAMTEAHAYTRDPKNADEVSEIGSRFADMTKDEVLRTKDFRT